MTFRSRKWRLGPNPAPTFAAATRYVHAIRLMRIPAGAMRCVHAMMCAHVIPSVPVLAIPAPASLMAPIIIPIPILMFIIKS